MSYFAAILTGLFLWGAFPPLGNPLLALWSLAPLLAVLWPRPAPETAFPAAWWRPTRAPGAFLHGYVAGAVFFLLNLQWLRHVTGLGMVMLALYLALYPAFWALFAATVGKPRHWNSHWEWARAAGLTGAAWTGLEWVRGIALTGFSWNGLGVALAANNDNLELAQFAEWIGVTGLSFYAFLWSAVIVATWRFKRVDFSQRSRRDRDRFAIFWIAVLATLLGLPMAGHLRMESFETTLRDAPPMTVALIQPNIPQESKNDYASFESIARTLARLTEDAFTADPKPDMVVWPESSLPAPYFYEGVQDALRQGAVLGDFVHVLGIDDQELDAYYNSVAVFRGDPLEAVLHHKVHLVPFGEYLPARGLFGKFEFIRAQLPGDFHPGTSTNPVPIPGRRDSVPADDDPAAASSTTTSSGSSHPFNPAFSLIPLVCFEDTLGRVARRFARPEPQLLVNVTNDAWFLDSEGADQHLANARFRAIELRRPMVRAANTGVTAVIDPLGRVTHQLPRLQEGQLKATFPQPTHRTLTVYARVGDLFSVSMLGLAAAATLPAIWQRISRRRSEAQV